MSVLGYGETRMLFTDRAGNRLAEVPARLARQVQWGRVNSDVSQMSASVGDPSPTMRNLEPWVHQILVFRSADLVWRGPVMTTEVTAAELTFTARDPAAYFDRRRVANKRTWFQEDLTRVAQTLIADAMAIDDPFNLVSTMVTAPSDIFITRTTEPDGRSLAEELKDLVEAGLRWTVSGGRLLLGPVGRSYTTAALTDRDIDGAFSVAKDGTEASTDALVLGKGVTGQFFDYGSPLGILQTVDKQDAITAEYQAVNSARQIVKDRSITPRRVTLPNNTKLLPTAPIALADLVVGVMVPVQSDATGVEVNSKMLIEGVKVNVGPAKEEVSVSLADAPELLTQQELAPPPSGYATEDDNPTYTKAK